MHVLIVNYVYDAGCAMPDALLERYESMTGWAESLLVAGAARVTVLQRYARDADVTRGGVTYLFRADGSRPHPRAWHGMWRLHAIAASLRPDIAHVQGLLFPAQTWLLRRALPTATAIVAQDHSGVFHERGGPLGLLRRVFYRVGLSAADALLFTAGAQADSWRAAGAIGPGQRVYEVLESSRRLRRVPREQARDISGVCGDPALLWVGHLDANKDPLPVLEGFERAMVGLPRARLTMIYGKTDLLPAVRARLAGSPALAERVELRGYVPYERMAAFFSAADLFVLGSRRESCGFALVEAIACGATPVVTDIPSFRAITAGGAVGRLWPPGDARALAEALSDFGRRDLEGLRAALAEHFERRLSWEAVGRRAMQIYAEAVRQRRDTSHDSAE